MSKTRSLVVIGMPGSNLDQGSDAGRWEKWRPTVDLCRHDHLLIDRFELLHQPQHARLSERLAQDIASVSPETSVRTHVVDVADMWDFEQVYGALHDFANG
jgi:transcriptional regulatory protein RtcR